MRDETESMYSRLNQKALQKRELLRQAMAAREIAALNPPPKPDKLAWMPTEWITLGKLAQQLNMPAPRLNSKLWYWIRLGMVERRGKRKQYEYRRKQGRR